MSRNVSRVAAAASLATLLCARAAAADFLVIGADQRAMGSASLGWSSDGARLVSRPLELGLVVTLPATLALSEGRVDTASLSGFAGLRSHIVGSAFADARLASSVSWQDQKLGRIVAWQLGAIVEPGIKLGAFDAFASLGLELCPLALYSPSDYALACFSERYANDSGGSAAWRSLLLSEAKLKLGLGTELRLDERGDRLALRAGIVPSLRPDLVSLVDGFSFGELPFYAELGAAIRL